MEIIKQCRKCKIELTEDNKVNRENLCKPCNKIINNEYRIKKGLIKQKPDISLIEEITIKNANNEILKCRKCQCDLTNINKVKKELICKACQKIKKSEWCYKKKNNIPLEPKKIVEKCSICSIEFTEENKIKNCTYCKKCRNDKRKESDNIKATEFVNSNIEVFCSKCSTKLTPELKVKGRNTCRTCVNEIKRAGKLRNKESIKEQNKIYYEQNKEKIAEYYKEHYKTNKDAYLNHNRKWRNENRDKLNEQARERTKTDENYRLKKNLRSRIRICITKNKPTMKYIGCDLEFLKQWLESLFTEEMTFDNYGSYWHVDHVIPCSKFDLENEDEINNCFHWTNLQPLESSKNMSKSNKIDQDNIKSHYKKVKLFAKKNNINLPKLNYKKYLNDKEIIL